MSDIDMTLRRSGAQPRYELWADYYVVSVKQNTKEWMKEREGSCGGSDIGSYVGFGNTCGNTRRKIVEVRKMCSHDKDPDVEVVQLQNDAMAHGHTFEPLCLHFFKRYMPMKLEDAIMVKPFSTNPRFPKMFCRFHASLDAYVDGHSVVEAKCPTSVRSYWFLRNRIPESYMAQVHLQMAVTGYKHAYIVVCYFEKGDTAARLGFVTHVEWCQSFWDWIYPKACDMISVLDDISNGNDVCDVEDWPEEWDMFPMVQSKVVFEKK